MYFEYVCDRKYVCDGFFWQKIFYIYGVTGGCDLCDRGHSVKTAFERLRPRLRTWHGLDRSHSLYSPTENSPHIFVSPPFSPMRENLKFLQLLPTYPYRYRFCAFLVNFDSSNATSTYPVLFYMIYVGVTFTEISDISNPRYTWSQNDPKTDPNIYHIK